MQLNDAQLDAYCDCLAYLVSLARANRQKQKPGAVEAVATEAQARPVKTPERGRGQNERQ